MVLVLLTAIDITCAPDGAPTDTPISILPSSVGLTRFSRLYRKKLAGAATTPVVPRYGTVYPFWVYIGAPLIDKDALPPLTDCDRVMFCPSKNTI
jgi:hypothetical protein